MTNSIKKTALVAAAAVMFVGAPAAAQNAATNNTDPGYTATDTRTSVVQKDDDDFPWGLLGLLGLAGLLGLKRKERDIHVDARHNNTRP